MLIKANNKKVENIIKDNLIKLKQNILSKIILLFNVHTGFFVRHVYYITIQNRSFIESLFLCEKDRSADLFYLNHISKIN